MITKFLLIRIKDTFTHWHESRSEDIWGEYDTEAEAEKVIEDMFKKAAMRDRFEIRKVYQHKTYK